MGTFSGGDIDAPGVTFTGGTLALAENVTVGSGTVLNSGAALSLPSRQTITGNYTQTSGTLTVVDNGLVVTGAADFGGGAVGAGSTGNYLAGSPTTLVSATSLTVTGTQFFLPDKVVGSVAVSGNNLVLSALNDYIGGTLASLTNSGTLSGMATPVYIASTGRLGTLTNTGTISGTAYAIENLGSLGTISNSGLIDGNIASASTLTIGGGSGTTGTLRGGSIVAAGVNFSTGTLALADNIIAGSGAGTVSNTGAVLALANPVTIDGNYRQSDGTLAMGASGALLISGRASITGGEVTASLTSSANYVVGEYRTLISAGGASSYDGLNSSISGPAGLRMGTTVIGNNYLVSYANDYIGGTRNSVTNTGVISGVTTGVHVAATGSLGSLTNTGTISGSAYAIHNLGSLGLIANSGQISGNIASSSDLTLAGGSGGTFGTFTGGTIQAAHVTLTSGFLWLRDAVSGTVVNHGATVKLDSAVAVSGDYRHTGGGMVIAVSSGGTYGYLTVSGAATVTDTAITISGTGLTVGQTFTIVRATTGSYSNNTAMVIGTSGLSASLSTIGNDLEVTLRQALDVYRGLGLIGGANAANVGGALDVLALASSTSTDMQSILTTIGGLPTPTAKATAIKQLAPAQTTPSTQMGNTAALAVLGAVEQHQQTAMAYDPVSGMAAGSEGLGNRLWGQVLGGGAIRGRTAEADGFRISEFGLASGIDHQFTERALGGVALSWVRAYANGTDGSTSNSTLDSYMLTGYGTYRLGALFFDGQTGVGYNRFHQNRQIAFLDRTATADFDGMQYLLRGQAGYDLPLQGGWKVTPLAGLAYLHTISDGYTESGAGAANLAVRRQGMISLNHDLGAKLTWSVDTAIGNLRPELRAEWVHDYRQAAVTTAASLEGAGFATSTARNSPDGVQLGLAATLDGPDALGVRVEYNGEMRAKYQSHVGMAKAIWGF
ncbi:autotransporter outer membrane beta-barrel domain-containing protein [Phaeospirillum tilakii]|uniref:Autotransporter domain-containing protein n=1 Tax=Phaeospirillum tilakii TaxID=741673 RepID=A0ABW5CC26_9PROT